MDFTSPSTYYTGITGIIERITPMNSQCCNQIISLRSQNGTVNFVLSPGTYVTDNTLLRTRMRITAFYDANLPVPLIYPPQYQAAFIGRTEPGENIMIDYFDTNLVSANNSLRLAVDPSTRVSTANGQQFTCDLGNHLLMVYYSFITRSAPSQTTPERIIVFC
ncbi:hypothetical protein [Kineothrix sp. MB12-C1]|uniref:hypothetical protein n=1 Tax=Kineothrix sp. MB12-C1 TaxID=3070215 RepID=UPI0027D2C15A|nr:hypothetical protein [Kineothrix sp. MB12-C1]WMC93140.1 hypothetical protein RBB56_02305 [Kineothrix sp. MB12-C1]